MKYLKKISSAILNISFILLSLIMRLALLAIAVLLVWAGITSFSPTMMGQLHNYVWHMQVAFVFSSLLAIPAGILVGIKMLTSSNENLLEPVFC